MRAVILAAGNGLRMRPLTEAVPKPLLSVRGKVLLDHLVEQFPDEIDELVIVVRYLGDQIRNYCGQSFYGRPVSYLEQPGNVHGTFAALKTCEPLLKPGERFFVFYADDLIARSAIAACLPYPCAIVAAAVADPTPFGVLELNLDGTLAGIIEKPSQPAANLVLTNTLLLDTRILQYEPPVNPNGDQYLTHALCQFARRQKIQVVNTNQWFPVGYPQDLRSAELFLNQAVVTP